MNFDLLIMPMKLLRLAAVSALVLCTATTVSADLLYNPVVLVTSGPPETGSSTGFATSISIFQQGVAGQTTPISTTTYNTDSNAGLRLVTARNSATGTLTNNPGVADAAAKGLLYSGTQYVYNAGYDAAALTASVSGSTGGVNNNPRSFGQTNVTNNIASAATVLQAHLDAHIAGAIRGAVGDDTGTAIYSAGTSATSNVTTRGSGGWRNFADNTILNTAVPASSTLHNVRTIELLASDVVGGRLFGTSANAGMTIQNGLYTIDMTAGIGPPATGTAPALYIGTPGTISSGSFGPSEFALFDDPTNPAALNLGYDTAYIVEGATDSDGGIQKWTWDGAAWTLAYTLADPGLGGAFGERAYFGLAGQLDAATNQITLYTTVVDTPDVAFPPLTKLQQVTDTGAASTFITLATLDPAVSGSAFQGVALSAAAASGLAGDYNGDGTVNAADYTVWRDGGSPDSSQAGYNLWKANFGNPPGAGNSSAVPEPASAMLLLLGLAILGYGRRSGPASLCE
ncbi:MAG: PEP-CTERM sorting domain-containing protein [Pirellulales bacterium]